MSKKPTVIPPDAVVQSSGIGYQDPLLIAVKDAVARSWPVPGVSAHDLIREIPDLTADLLLAMLEKPANGLTLVWHDEDHRPVYIGSFPAWPLWVFRELEYVLGESSYGQREHMEYAIEQGWVPVPARGRRIA